ncbi:MAG TPA: HRDC domain-containing protein, partial [Anaerolineales bacterium]|nr:HRDC domain-containing protein [Anaerolineales bacterium]
QGTQAPLVKRKPTSRPNDAVVARLDKLKTWRKKVAQEMSVESDIVLPKSYVQLLADRAPRTTRDLEVLMIHSPWRFKKFGSQILEILGG